MQSVLLLLSNDSEALQLPEQLSYALSDGNDHFQSPDSTVPASVHCRGNTNPSNQVFFFIHMYAVCV